MFTCDTGYEDHIQSVCSDLWVHAMRFHSISTPKFYSRSFESKCDELLNHHYKMKHSQVTVDNFERIYKFILQNYH